MLEDMLTHILITFYTIFEDMFIPCLKICLHNIWEMFTLYLKTYLHQVRRPFTMFVVIFTQVWKILLYHVWQHVYTKFKVMVTPILKHVWWMKTAYIIVYIFTYSIQFHTIYDDMVKQCFKHIYIYTLFENLFIRCLYICLQKIMAF